MLKEKQVIGEFRLLVAQMAAARVPGPKMGDANAPLPERLRVFRERLDVFRRALE